MTTDIQTRLDALKPPPPGTGATAAASASPEDKGPPRSPVADSKSAPPVADARLVLEKTIDLATETHAALADTHRMLAEAKAEIASMHTNLPAAVASAVKQAILPVTTAQRDDIYLVKQQSQQNLALQTDLAGSIKALLWIWGIIGLVVIAAIGRQLL